MLEKIISIENVGQFKNFVHRGSVYSEFSKNVIVYAENGSGKTTLSVILKSLKDNDALLIRKKSFGSSGSQKVKLKYNGRIVEHKDGKWSELLENIEVFDVHFIEDNLYTGSTLAQENKTNLFDFIVGEKGAVLNNELAKLNKENHDYHLRNVDLSNYLLLNFKKAKSKAYINSQKELAQLKAKMKALRPKIRDKSRELGEYTGTVFNKHVEEINKRLKVFAPYIEIKKFSNRSKGGKHSVSYFLYVNGNDVSFDLKQSNSTVKYSLSEGDKSAVALAFFFARVYMSGDIGDKIIVFDDPISSFDSNRRATTVSQLQKLSKECKQLFVLTHDIYFAQELVRRLDGSTLNLKIIRKSGGSELVNHNIEQETLIGYFKDLSTLTSYTTGELTGEAAAREVIRCIRPALEGILRIKFFGLIGRDEWLGDVLKKIRAAKAGDPFYNVKKFTGELSDLNDYSKSYHHSDPAFVSLPTINEIELLDHVKRTLALVREI